MLEALYDEGYKRSISIDFSSKAIDKMIKRNEEVRPDMQFIVCDMLSGTSFIDGNFDFCLDKGTLDAIVCGADAEQNVIKYLAEVRGGGGRGGGAPAE